MYILITESKVQTSTCFVSPSRTVSCWHLTSQTITPGGLNTGRGVWGEKCHKLRGSAPQRATPTSLLWAAWWTTSTSRWCTAAHRFLLLWVQVRNARETTSRIFTCRSVHVWTCGRSSSCYMLNIISSLARCGIYVRDGEEGDVFVSLWALSSIYSSLLFCLSLPPFLCPGHWMKNWSVVLSGWD